MTGPIIFPNDGIPDNHDPVCPLCKNVPFESANSEPVLCVECISKLEQQEPGLSTVAERYLIETRHDIG